MQFHKIVQTQERPRHNIPPSIYGIMLSDLIVIAMDASPGCCFQPYAADMLQRGMRKRAAFHTDWGVVSTALRTGANGVLHHVCNKTQLPALDQLHLKPHTLGMLYADKTSRLSAYSLECVRRAAASIHREQLAMAKGCVTVARVAALVQLPDLSR